MSKLRRAEKGKIILDYLGGPRVITRVFQTPKRDVVMEDKECRRLLEGEKGRKMDSALVPEGMSLVDTLTLAS